ncbi:PBECR2 nuclease fold domain-containing protein [Neptunomonas sp.]|uniref:PBECR2 nuclease fold domain-containing protein n=1 Tax=Neptunomonas sp. TaxID=1971898 RepID=UPI0025D62CB4|nr:PBECR2 nuclease fold domain-containing protein [Neptunomonas sp.]
MPSVAEYGSRPFKEAIDYFNQKLPLPTNGWQDVYDQQHDHAFMVAGANKTSIIEGFANALQGAIEGGETLQDFRKRFDSIVQKEGWDYNGSRHWRSRLIYETNIRQAYNAGREAQMADPAFQKQFPYKEYRHSGAEHYRPQHKAWDRLLLLANDPWWQVHSPSNGYGCKCKAFPRSRRWMQRNGKTLPDQAPQDTFKEYLDKRTGEVIQIPLGIDPGFEHRPGASWLRHATLKPAELPTVKPIPIGPAAKPPLPAPTAVSESVLMADGLADEVYVKAFLDEFGLADTSIFKDIKNEALAINELLFKNANGERITTAIKDKRYTRLLARALIQPDEIWNMLEPDQARPGKYKLKRRYISRFQIAGEAELTHSIFEITNGTWATSIVTGTQQANSLRQGVQVYSSLEDSE